MLSLCVYVCHCTLFSVRVSLFVFGVVLVSVCSCMMMAVDREAQQTQASQSTTHNRTQQAKKKSKIIDTLIDSIPPDPNLNEPEDFMK